LQVRRPRTELGRNSSGPRSERAPGASLTHPRRRPLRPGDAASSGRGSGPPRRPSLRVRRRRAVAFFVGGSVAVLAIVAAGLSGGPGEAVPRPPATSFRVRIVTIAESQLGYTTDPTHSYCNKYSAYWGAGTGCAHGLRSEEWCADFAAWVWRKAGALFTYSYARGDIDAAAASFYLWAVAHGTWHAATSGYVPKPGDVAVYGLVTTPTNGTSTASHVAVVTAGQRGARGPDVVNGDGDRTGFSVVEDGTDQYRADIPGGRGYLDGYASPIAPAKGAGP